MNQTFAKLIFRSWPLPFGHSKLMKLINPPAVLMSYNVSKIRGYQVKLKYDPNSYIGRYIFYRGIYEEQIIHKIASMVKPAMTVIDIGANIGLHTNICASLVRSKGRILTMEPQSKARALLKENVKLNNFTNIQILDYALGRASNTASIFLVNEKNNGQATLIFEDQQSLYPSEEINVRTLDFLLTDLTISKVDIVKIDVEGAEMAVLEGGKDFFRASPPQAFFIECIDQHLRRFGASSEELVSWLNSEGYKTYGLMQGRWKITKPAPALRVDLMAIK